MRDNQQIFICSDAVGETAEAVVRAAMRQFAFTSGKLRRYGHIKHADEVRAIVDEASRCRGVIAYTLVQPELNGVMREETSARGVRAVDVLSPMMQAFIDTFEDTPNRIPGLNQSLDAEYYRKIEAMEFAVHYDDGKDLRGITLADVVLIGVSRTSKTPICLYMAHKGIRATNWPLVPEIPVPEQLLKRRNGLVVGLTMDPDKLVSIRTERLKALGLPKGSVYATAARVEDELRYANRIMNMVGCEIIDVTNKAIEETVGIILERLPADRAFSSPNL
ncbi:pyruvate, water dikinase regulatory protein [Paenibacillus methanolicus]|uniref:Putative pyruvate, phosphate dikinase regulatory protein n=1 Tax=Paenibacillus methanolicus TaxID=582686 RepID=A0A5S5BRP4_9BACL|nr:pyruvate, water dikinase regulatory protein [Paenibacillus methanolicus]TYP68966.1 hypothetical protein BCM02_11784 [Paenibacillus methanolicus]